MAIISIPTSVAGVSIPGQVGDILSGPLKALYGGAGLKDTYNYPADLGSDPTKLHYVQFAVKEILPAGFTSVNGSQAGVNVGVGNLSGVGSLLGSILGTPIDYVNSGISSAKSFLNNLPFIGSGSTTPPQQDTTSYGTKISDTLSGALADGITISPRTTQLKSIISLYMPDTLTASYDASYEELSLRDLGAGINTLRNINQIAAKGGSGQAGLDKLKKYDVLGALSALGTDPAGIDLAMTAMGSSGIDKNLGINADVLGGVLLKGQGYAINPQLQMIYRGIGLRSFQLSFYFTPKSQDEAKNVENIINMFKYHFAPSIQTGASSSTTSMFLIPPSIFNVTFNINGKENKYLPKYGDCVLSNIDVNYAPNGWASHEDGFPVQTQLTLEFKETEIIYKDKLLQGFAGKAGGVR